MHYLIKQDFNFQDLVDWPRFSNRVLLIINEEPLRQIYSRHLLENRFEVFASDFGNFHEISKKLETVNLMVLELKPKQEEDRLEFLKTVVNHYPKVSIITIGHALKTESLESLMALGAAGHIDRKYSRPQDIVYLANTIINQSKRFPLDH